MRLRDIARAVDADVDGDDTVDVVGLSPIDDAVPGTLTFLADGRMAAHLADTRAAAVIVARDAPPTPVPALRAAHPYLAFVRAMELFHPPVRPPAGIHPSACVAPDATLGPDAHVGAHAVIGAGATIGARAVIHPNVTIYAGVQAGDDFVAHAGAVVREGVLLGHRVTLHAGAVVGSDGFGFVPLPQGHRKIPQVGTVVLEDDVEIGANATVDRATLGETRVGRGTKIDNLVIVAHGCRIGPGCLLAAQVGLAGSTRLGRGVMMGGQVGAAGHLEVGDGVQVAAQSGIHGDLPAGGTFGGTPAMEIRVWRRMTMHLPRLPEIARRLRRLEQAVGIAPRRRRAGEP